VSKPNNGGPAFPVYKYVNADGKTFTSEPTGMTLRDYFAAAALRGLLADGVDQADSLYGTVDDITRVAYIYADAMLAARGAKP
jgi:hypothetical protein